MSEPNPINHQVHTPCRDCFFADYEENTQTGCGLNLLDKYQEIDDHCVIECYDDNLEFFLVNNMVCMFYIDKNRLVRETTREELFEAMRRLIKVRYHVIILVYDSDIKNLETTLKSIEKQEHPPILLTVIKLHDCTIKGGDIFKLFHKVFKNKATAPKWRIQNVINPELTKEDYIDIAVDGTRRDKYNFYCIFTSGFVVPQQFGHRLDVMINDDIKRFYIVKGQEDYNGMIVPLTTHLRCNGNSHGVYLTTKLEAELCDENKILQIQEVFPEWF